MKRILFSLMTLVAALSVAGVGSFANLADTGISTGNIFVAAEWGVIGVGIDIKPCSNPNSINPDSNGVIPVAILTTAYFDAADVDALTVRFGPDEAWAKHWALEDVDNDGDEDMILHFRTQDTGIKHGDTQAELVGETLEGRDIHGLDSVRTVPPWEDE